MTSLLETHLIPFFGDDRLMSEFAIEDVERFVAHMKGLPGLKADTMSSVRLNKARNLLRKVLDNEVRLLFDKGFQNEPEMRRLYTVAIFTGLRTSELIGLKWAIWTGRALRRSRSSSTRSPSTTVST